MPAKTKDSKKELKAEDKQLRDYELICIINSEAGDEALETSISSISQFITGKGGIIADEERWGKRKLAYPIRRFLEGSYVLTRFKMQPAWGKELEASLRISEDILRYLLIKVGD